MYKPRRISYSFVALITLSFMSSAQAVPTEQQSLEVKEWFALGSGCRGRNSEPGDVKVTTAPLKATAKSGKEDGVNLLIKLPTYKLDGNKPIRAEHPTFARECALRFGVFPAPGTRISEVRTAGTVSFRKDLGAKVRLATQLHLGETVAAQKELEFDKDRNIFSGNEQINIVASVGNPMSKAALLSSACGAPRVVGVDLSFTTWRDSKTPVVTAELSNNGEFSVEIVTEPCKPEASTSQNR